MLHVDASFLIAMLDPDDQWHAKAVAAMPGLAKRGGWTTHALAVGEVVALIGSRCGGKPVRNAYEMIRETVEVTVPTLAQMDDAMGIVVQSDGALSLSDALFVHAVRSEPGTKTAILSFDSGFEKAGLRRLP